MSLDDVNALKPPAINISREGIVPTKEEVFRIVLPCATGINAEVDVNIYFNLTLPKTTSSPNVTSLILRRKKICFANAVKSNDPSFPPSVVDVPAEEDGDLDRKPPSLISSPKEESVKDVRIPHLQPSSPAPPPSSSSSSNSNPVSMAIGCAALFVFLMGLLSLMCYLKSRKNRASLERR